MEPPNHSLSELFDQLGLPSSEKDIEDFILLHRPLAPSIPLHEASFWSKPQKAFLKQQLDVDADWAELVDQLNTRLR